MILKKLYTTPEFFKPVIFKTGFNFIFGRKDAAADSKESLNGIGKSAFLELIDFALLSSFKKNDGKRIQKAFEKGLLKGATVFLEFEVDKVEYRISRSFDKPRIVYFSEIDSAPVQYTSEDLSEVICDIIFKRSEYTGQYDNHWLRKLLPFFIKIQFSKDHKFLDPIKYLKQGRYVELMQYHFFLMDIDNTLSYQNYQLQKELSLIEPALEEISDVLSQTYKLNDIRSTEIHISNLKIKIDDLQKGVDNFKLSKSYAAEEKKADVLTEEIKQLWFKNNNDHKMIDNYLSSFNLDLSFNTAKVKQLFDEFGLFTEKIKKELDEVIDFKKSLIKSRKEFLNGEIDRLKQSIQERTETINSKEEERSKIYGFLSKHKAITDLTSAYQSLDKLKDELNELESQIRSYRDITKRKLVIQTREKAIEAEIFDFVDKINQQQFELAKLISQIYNKLYADPAESSVFVIGTNFRTQQKFQFSILDSSKMLSTGRNQGRTLIYDLTVLFNSIAKGFKAPRFLIHDGIFNEMDKSHLIELYKYLNEKQKEGLEFQYILTLNEEGTLSENFGDSDLLTPDKIEQESILVLKPSSKLFGEDF